ncbi:NDR1/HIN1-like protein [Flammeovirga kamogawensis]|uniref:LEA type 2 family protein n=1 Tax=Flammeovirga kamogawensis TaxID=373891 RepID=A0ABX8GW93_9BACT|nr:LEA type 2 family protein [Flammeovirga kamogawensis]MBB6461252.1 LEA14-like dessication related protein [Flammeovirga kamogawensis]QWG07811.1 LEA type 2 family protein [Flammeovirga kamogawensis]TRX69617.1 LEA type 2 family protein [Flammeovirga kamogawensis]
MKLKSIVQYIVYLIVLVTFTACGPEAPEFNDVKNVEMFTLEDGNFVVRAEAVLYNPNGVSITVDQIHVDVLINGNVIGNVDQNLSSEAKKKSEFTLPLEVQFPPKALFSNILGGLINMATGEDFEVRYTGFVRTKVLGVSFKVPFDQVETVGLNLK